MASSSSSSRLLQAVAALQRFDRRGGAALLAAELRDGPPNGERWRSAGLLAKQIGEIDLAIECARRCARTARPTLERQLYYWGELAAAGRADEAAAEIDRLPAAARDDPGVLHFAGALAGEAGDFSGAERYYRKALQRSPGQAQTWFALAMIKRFHADDPDLAAMDRIRPAVARGDPMIHARFLYGLAKAWDDAGDRDRAFRLYDEGAALRRGRERFDAQALARFVDGLIGAFTPDAFARLAPSRQRETRSLFVNGLPRSGTTLVEQIVASHSGVGGGAEVNLIRAALIPTGDYSLEGAIAFQQRHGTTADPWGDLARDYNRMIDMRFRDPGLVVDKTLSQSHFMGLILHTLPAAKVVWMRRDPADTALSTYRSFFTAAISWSWSLTDIAAYYRQEDRLFRHWNALFPDRILVVPYEALVRDSETWIPRILGHFGLPDEPEVRRFHESQRPVRTASVQQVRAPVSTARIGAADAYGSHMDAFRQAYAA